MEEPATGKKEIQQFLEEYRDDNLFQKVPGREHTAFPGYVNVQTIDRPASMKQRLKKYGKKLDIYQGLLPR